LTARHRKGVPWFFDSVNLSQHRLASAELSERNERARGDRSPPRSAHLEGIETIIGKPPLTEEAQRPKPPGAPLRSFV